MVINFKKFVWSVLVLAMAIVALPQAASAADAETARKITKRVEPVYPPIAKQARLTGTVRLVFDVTAEGAVKNVRTTGGNPVLASAAEEAVRLWKYEPAKKETVENAAIRFSEPQ